jgi:D-amino-acid dehydrogenase
MVICAGVESRRLASKLGDRINIYPVKGYSITVQLDDDKSKAAAPQVSLLDDETKLVSSRLGEGRFRVAGTAEFNGFDRNIRADRIEPLVSWVKSCFPGVSTRQVIPWAGLRPMMPDMMPRVCQGSKTNIFYNTGHGHLGWTLGAITAVKLSELVSLWQKQTATASSRRLLTKPAQIASARINS